MVVIPRQGLFSQKILIVLSESFLTNLFLRRAMVIEPAETKQFTIEYIDLLQ